MLDANNPVFVISGRARWSRGGPDSEAVAILVQGADDDAAVRRALDALSEQGYAGAELDRIGVLSGVPEDEPFKSAFSDALGGEVAIVRLQR